MKQLIVFFFSMFLHLGLIGQNVPYFETTIWVEDAIGNRDSVVVGFDPNATDEVDTTFGEIPNDSAFDSILDVRAGEMYFCKENMYQKIIAS